MSEARAPLVEVVRVEKTYGAGETAVHALRGIDLRIDAGEFVALMGPSGSCARDSPARSSRSPRCSSASAG